MPSDPVNFSLRKDEILALTAIYDELCLETELSGSLVIPVELAETVVHLHTESRGDHIRLLPGIEFGFSTGGGYPETNPPDITLRSPWLPEEKANSVVAELRDLWEGSKECCLFSMIDEVRERATVIFGLESVSVSEDVFDQVVAFAEAEEFRRFLEGIYFCVICLEHKKGAECFKLSRCEHVFCKVRH